MMKRRLAFLQFHGDGMLKLLLLLRRQHRANRFHVAGQSRDRQ